MNFRRCLLAGVIILALGSLAFADGFFGSSSVGAWLGANVFTGAQRTPAGTTSLPGLAVGIAGTGLSQATNQLQFDAAGVEEAYIDASSGFFVDVQAGILLSNAAGVLKFGASGDTVVARSAAGVTEFGLSGTNANGYIKAAAFEAGIVYSVAGTPLPSAATLGIGAKAFVSDATACTPGTTYAGSGSTACPVYSDGTLWKEGG